jgi:hypothetical protein
VLESDGKHVVSGIAKLAWRVALSMITEIIEAALIPANRRRGKRMQRGCGK